MIARESGRAQPTHARRRRGRVNQPKAGKNEKQPARWSYSLVYIRDNTNTNTQRCICKSVLFLLPWANFERGELPYPSPSKETKHSVRVYPRPLPPLEIKRFLLLHSSSVPEDARESSSQGRSSTTFYHTCFRRHADFFVSMSMHVFRIVVIQQ